MSIFTGMLVLLSLTLWSSIIVIFFQNELLEWFGNRYLRDKYPKARGKDEVNAAPLFCRKPLDDEETQP